MAGRCRGWRCIRDPSNSVNTMFVNQFDLSRALTILQKRKEEVMDQDRTANKDTTNPVLEGLLAELAAAKNQITRQELKIEVLASQILQLRADQLRLEETAGR